MKKFKNLIDNPFMLVFLWIVFLLFPLASVIRYNYLVHFSGASDPIRLLLSLSYIVYRPLFLSLATVVLVAWVKKYIDGKISRRHTIALLVIAFASAIFNIGAGQLLDFNFSHYPNYLYTIYGVRPEDLKFVSTVNYIIFGLTAGLFSAKASTIVKKGVNKGIATDRITNVKILLTVMGLLILSIQALYPFSKIRTLLRIPKEGYETKLGWRYVYIENLASTVPENAKIIHPPQGSKWPEVGNQPIIRYFLFPRTLISGVLVDNQTFAEEIEEVYFPDISDPPWPMLDRVNKLVIFNEEDPISYKKLEKISEREGVVVYKIKFK